MKFNYIRLIAKRFSGSARDRRFLNFARIMALLSVTIGSMALVISLAVLEGFQKELLDTAVQSRSHIVLTSFRHEPLGDYPATVKTLETEFPQIEGVAPIAEKEGLVRSSGNVEGVMLRGVFPEKDLTGMKEKMVEGSWEFSSSEAHEVIIGQRLAEKIGAAPGDELVVYAIDMSAAGKLPRPRADKFRITGLYRTGMAQYDDVFIYMPFAAAAEFFRYPEGSASSFEIMVSDVERAGELSEKISTRLGYPYFTLTVFDLHASMFAWIDLQKEPIPIVLTLISIVAVMNIISTLLIIVVEKTNSIGILRALGMRSRNILSIFIVQGVSIGLAGTLLGSGIGAGLCFLQQQFGIISLQGDVYFLDAVPISMLPWHFAVIIGMSLLLSFLATLIPALVATRINPLRAIKFK